MKKITTNETTINNPQLQKFIIPLLLLSLALIFSFTMDTASAAVRGSSPVSDTIYVNNATGNDSWDGQSATWISGTKTGPKLSIKNATGTVNQGGTVKIAKGIYKGENNTGITIDRNMTIIGQSRTGTVIDAQGKDIFHIMISGINVTILNLTFKNGTSSLGGAISNKGNLTVNNCDFTGNKATVIGGAIINYGALIAKNCTFKDNIANGNSGAIANSGTGIITGCTFTNNIVTNGNGGAIFNFGGILTVNDSTFTGNHANMGGAIYNEGGNCNIAASTFKNNGNCEEGGAIYNNNTLNIKDSIFTSNRAGWGGAIANYGTSTITGSTFGGDNKKANIATYEGGAIYNGYSYTEGNYIPAALTLNSCTFKYNIADDSSYSESYSYAYGGAISNDGTLNANKCIFDHNRAIANSEAFGGAIQNHNTCTITDSIFTNNSANVISRENEEDSAKALGGAIYCKGDIKLTCSTLSGNSVSASGEGSNIADVSGGALFIYDKEFNAYEIIGNHIIYNTCSGISLLIERDYESTALLNSPKKIINFNRIYGNTPYGIENFIPKEYSQKVTSQKAVSLPEYDINAKYNWWGSNSGPNTAGADKTNLGAASYTPWIVMGFSPSQVNLNSSKTTLLTANFLYDSNGSYHDPTNGHIPNGTPVKFVTSLGQVGSQWAIKYTVNAVATTLLRAWNAAGGPVWGTAVISATTDAQTLSNRENILNTGTKTTKVKAASKTKTIPLQKTGLPLAGILLAVLAVFSGLVTSKKK